MKKRSEHKLSGYWDNYDNCKNEVLKYNNKTEFCKKSKSTYKAIIRNGWIDELMLLLDSTKKPNGYWTYERCQEEALKYDNKSDFQKYSSSAYNVVAKNKWKESICSHMQLQGNLYKRLIYAYEFSDNHVYIGLTGNIKRRNNQHLEKDIDSSVYKHIQSSQLQPKLIIKTDLLDVDSAIKMEQTILDDYKNNGWVVLNIKKTGGIGSHNLIWTYEKCKEEALKYNKLITFQKESKSAYNTASKNGWLDEITPHIKRCKTLNGYWNNEELCAIEAKKYNNKSSFQKGNWSSYNYSKINGWLDTFFPKI